MGLSVACFTLLAFVPNTTHAEEVDCGKDPVYERNFSAVTNVGSRVRSIACMTGSKILTVLPAKTKVSVIAETDGWYKVKVGDKIGWVGRQLLTKTSADTAEQTAKAVSTTPKAIGLTGISEANYNRLKAKNKSLIKLLKNKIVLRVLAKGQAYFVDANGDLTYLKNGDEVKKYLKAEIKETPQEKKQTEAQPQISSNGQITLTAILVDPGKVKLTWDSTADTPKGFKVVISESENPVYPGNDYHYLSDPSIRQDTWSGLGNKTYHFRVCQYLGSACGVYSNNATIQVTTNGASTSNVTAGTIVLSATPIGNGKVAMTWSLKDMTSSKGFKVVVSENTNPVYPGNDYHYYSEPNKSDDVWSGLEAGKTYHFRVCEYLGGYCGVYSNDVTAKVE